MLSAADLRAMSRRELSALLRDGHAIDVEALDDREYHGVSLGLPSFVDRLTWKKFMKVFYRDPARRSLRGWNVPVEQNALAAPWLPRAQAFGHFEVRSDDRGLLLDYAAGSRFPLSLLRDPLVAVNAGSAELLLGWSYLDVRGVRLGTPSYFSLERGGRLRRRVDPPRG